MKKLLAVAAVTAALTTTLTACGGDDEGADGATKVTFGYIGDFNGTSLLAVAEDQGLWEDAGLEVETKVFTDGPTQIQALGTDDLDYGYIGPGAVWLPASGQADIIAVNTLGGADRVIAQPGIDSIEDLRGKKVGVPEGTSGDMILGLALEAAGMSKDDVELVPMDPATVVSAFGSGQIDAAGIFYPLIDAIKEQVPDLVELSQNSDFEPDFAFPTSFVAGGEADDETTAEVVKVLREAMDYRAENTEEAIAATAEMLGQDEEAVARDAGHNQLMTAAELDAATEDGTAAGWFSGLEDFFVTAGKLDEAVDPSEFYRGDDFVAAGK